MDMIVIYTGFESTVITIDTSDTQNVKKDDLTLKKNKSAVL